MLQWKAGSARWGNLQQSRSVWASPVSAMRISRVRAEEIAEAVRTWTKQSKTNSVEFLTLTVRHNREQSLTDVWKAVSAGWRGITQGAAWRGGARTPGDKRRFGIKHFCRAIEVTHGKNGWHVHAHVLLFLEKRLSCKERSYLENRLFERWAKALDKAGFDAPTRKNGVRIEEAIRRQDANAMGAYMAKGSTRSIGDEIARGQQKSGRKESKTPFQILSLIADARENGETYGKYLRLWHEWESSSWGKSQLTWSKGAKKELGISALSDEQAAEIADLEDEVDAHAVAIVSAENWSNALPGADRRLSDDTAKRSLITDYVGRAKTPVQAEERAREIFSVLELPAEVITPVPLMVQRFDDPRLSHENKEEAKAVLTRDSGSSASNAQGKSLALW